MQLTFVCQQLIKRVPPLECFFGGGPADKSRAVLQQAHLSQVSHCVTHPRKFGLCWIERSNASKRVCPLPPFGPLHFVSAGSYPPLTFAPASQSCDNTKSLSAPGWLGGGFYNLAEWDLGGGRGGAPAGQ